MTYDVVYVELEFTHQVRGRLRSYFGSRVEVLTSAIHTHSGPFINRVAGERILNKTVNADYYDLLIRRSLTAAKHAFRRLTACLVRYLEIDVPGLMKNRAGRRISAPLSQTFFFQQRGAGGRHNPCGVLTFFPMHPTTVLEKNPQVSADYVYFLRQRLGRWFKAPVLFMAGAGGDQGPVLRGANIGKWLNYHFFDRGSFRMAEENGLFLADQIIGHFENARLLTRPGLSVRRFDFSLPEKRPTVYFSKKRLAKLDGVIGNTEFFFIQLGGITIITIPGEISQELANTIPCFQEKHRIISNCVSDWTGYWIEAGHYRGRWSTEAAMSFFGPNFEDIVRREYSRAEQVFRRD